MESDKRASQQPGVSLSGKSQTLQASSQACHTTCAAQEDKTPVSKRCHGWRHTAAATLRLGGSNPNGHTPAMAERADAGLPHSFL